jgi:signal transduction histidine kinase/DNA-binding response OmpR family regulator
MPESQHVRRLFQTLKASSEFPWVIMCALALVVVIYLSLSDWQQVRQANEDAKISDESLRQLHLLDSAIQEAEASQRGYLITGRETYLELYNRARKEVPSLMQGVGYLAGSTISQKARLAELNELIRLKFLDMERSVELQRQGDPTGAIDLVKSNEGKVLMDRLRSVVQEIDQVELRKHLENRRQIEHLAAIAGGASSIAVLLGLLLLTVAVWRIQREKAAVFEANAAKSRFLANMSHELRTPLNAIIGYSEMLQEEAEDIGHTEFVPDLGRIRTAGRHLLDLINSVLDLSKIEAGKMDLYLESFSIRNLVDEAESVTKPLADKNGNKLLIDCPSGIGNMYGDQTKIRQCLFNLLSNAAKFTEKGDIKLEVRREPGTPDMITFQVFDTGVGMSKEEVDRIFEPFTQADASTTRRFGGTGLGLAITHKFCELMGGTIHVDSTLGAGSTFTIALPATLGNAPDVVTRDQPATESRGQSLVLAIDDDPSVHDLVKRTLFKHGFAVESAYSGEDGLRLARKLRPDAITLDVLMRGMDGWAVLSALKSDHEVNHIPVIMLTVMDNRNQAFLLGAAEYLSKPVDRSRLIEVLSRYRHQRHPGSVLVVEDDFDSRRIITNALRSDGWVVDEAENGRAALECIEKSRPTLILLDLMMPQMDGFEFVARFRESPANRNIPIVVLTAKEITPDERVRLNGQVFEIVQKGSIGVDEILSDLASLISRQVNEMPRKSLG